MLWICDLKTIRLELNVTQMNNGTVHIRYPVVTSLKQANA